MCSQLKRCGMVGTDKDFYILVLEFVKQLAEYLFVNKAYCLYLIVNLITMTAFILPALNMVQEKEEQILKLLI